MAAECLREAGQGSDSGSLPDLSLMGRGGGGGRERGTDGSALLSEDLCQDCSTQNLKNKQLLLIPGPLRNKLGERGDKTRKQNAVFSTCQVLGSE